MRLLILDDDADLRMLALRALTQEFPAAEARAPADRAAFEAALAEGFAPDLLVTDYALHGMDGFEVLARVRTASPECCALMFTGTGDEEVAVRALKAGFDDYVTKRQGNFRRLAVAAAAVVARAAERQLLRRNQETLLEELYHRLHNTMQLVVTLLDFTLRALRNPADRRLVEELGERMHAIAELQEQLYRARDFREVDFAALLARRAAALGTRPGTSVAPHLAPLCLPADIAGPLALLANEVLVQAASQPGPVSVTLERRGAHAVLHVTGPGLAGHSAAGTIGPAGLGLHLVRRLAAQIGATLEMPATEAGVACRVSLEALLDP